MKKICLVLITCLLIAELTGQDSILTPKKKYNIKYKVDIPVTVGLWGLNVLGLYQLSQKPTLDTNQLNALNKNDVWSFDRRVFYQSAPAPDQIYTLSDIGLWTSFFLPSLLFIDKDIRNDWLDITILYFETQAINYNLYVWAGPVFTKRVRPLVYYDETSMDYRLGKGTTDAWFSGHVSMSAGATFFMAKVLSDYHPEWGGKRAWLYVAALIPPAVVGYYRYRGMMHFPTDLMTGMAIGAAVGILIPHLQKITRKKNKDLSIVPFTGGYSGVAFSMRF